MSVRNNYVIKVTHDHSSSLNASPQSSSNSGSDFRFYADSAKTELLSHWTDPTTLGTDSCVSYVKLNLSASSLTPTMHLTFDDVNNSGTIVADIYGFNSGTLVSDPNSPITGTSARVGEGIAFDTFGYMEVPNFTVPNLYGASGESTWAFTLDPNVSGLETIASKYDTADAREFIIVLLAGSIPRVSLYTHENDAITNIATDPLGAGSVHFSVVYDNTQPRADKIKFYVEGSWVTSSTDDVGSYSVMTASSSPFRVATLFEDGSPGNSLSASIEDVLWINKACTDDEIMQLAQYSKQGLRPDLDAIGISTSSVIGYWPMDNRNIGAEPQDISGNGNHGTITGTVGTGRSSSLGQALSSSLGQAFEFSSGSVAIPSSPSIHYHTGTSGLMTMGAWIKPTVLGANMSIITKIKASEYEYGFMLVSGKPAFLAYHATPTSYIRVDSTMVTASQNEWSHVMFRYDASQVAQLDKIDIFVNGTEAAKTLSYDVGTFTQMTSGTAPMRIGATNASPSQDYFTGSISNPQYYNSLLTDAEILELYKTGINGFRSTADISKVYLEMSGTTNRVNSSSAENTFGESLGAGFVHSFDLEEKNTSGSIYDGIGIVTGTLSGVVINEAQSFGRGRQFLYSGSIDFDDDIFTYPTCSIPITFKTPHSGVVLLSNYNGTTTQDGMSVELTGGYMAVRHNLAGTGETLVTSSYRVNDNTHRQALIEIQQGSTIKIHLLNGSSQITSTGSLTNSLTSSTSNARLGGYTDLNAASLSTRIADCIADWDATVITNLSGGSTVAQWEDRVGSHNATQATPADRPIYLSAGINGRPCVQFDRTNHYFNLTSSLDIRVTTTSDFDIFMVFQPDISITGSTTDNFHYIFSDASSVNFMGLGNGGGYSTSETFTAYGSVGVGDGVYSNTGSDGVPYLSGDSYLMEFARNGSINAYRIDGVGLTLTPITTAFNGFANVLIYFGGLPGGSCFNGRMGRVLVFDRLLSATERNEVLRTLVLQWSLYQEPYTSLEIDELRIASSSLSSSFITSYIESGSYPQLVGGQQVALRPRIDPEPVVSYSGTL